MTKPHSHRGEPRGDEQDADRVTHIPSHVATDSPKIQGVDEPEAQRA